MRRRLCTIATLLGLLDYHELKAQEPLEELGALLNTPIRAASRRLQATADSPQAVEVITRDQIRASGAFRLVDVLRLATNLQVWDKDPARANVTLRGINPDDVSFHLQLLVDGIPLFNFVSTPIDFNGLPVPLDAIERIEIVRGPSSSLYGSNAASGVISITTRQAQRGTEGSVRLALADHGDGRGQAFVSHSGDAFGLVAALGGAHLNRRGTQNVYVGLPALHIPADTSTQERQAFLRVERALEDSRWWISLGRGQSGPFSEVAYNTPTVSPSIPAPFPSVTFPGQAILRNLAQAGWTQTWARSFSTELRLQQKVFINRLEPIHGNPGIPAVVELLQALDPAFRGPRDFYHDRVREVTFQGNWDPSERFHVVAGMDAKRIETSVNLIVGLNEAQRASAAGLYVSADWSHASLTWSLSLRSSRETLGGHRLHPRAVVLWKPLPEMALRLGFYTASRSPNVREKYSSIPGLVDASVLRLPSVDLKPETARSVEAGFRFQGNGWFLDATAYRTELQDLIAQSPTGEVQNGRAVLRYQNSPRHPLSRGLEVSLTAILAGHARIGLNSAVTRLQDPVYDRETQADYSPEYSATLWYRGRLSRLFLFGALQQVGPWTAAFTYRTDAGLPTVLRSRLSPSTQLHVHIGWETTSAFSVAFYGIQALKPDTPAGNQAMNNVFALRTTRREIGLQGTWRY